MVDKNNKGLGMKKENEKDAGNGNPKRTARIAGLLYLGVIIFGITAQVIRQNIVEWGNASETAKNIMDSELLFRLSFASDMVMILCFMLLPLAFYMLFRSENKHVVSLVVIFVLVSIPIMLVNLLLYFSPVILLDGADYLSAFSADQLAAMSMFFLDLYSSGVRIATLFHGLWLLPLGYLVYKSDRFPKIIGIFLMLACAGFAIETIQYFLLPDLEAIIYPGMLFEIIGEFGFWVPPDQRCEDPVI